MVLKNKKTQLRKKEDLLELRKKIKETTYEEFLKRPGSKLPPEG